MSDVFEDFESVEEQPTDPDPDLDPLILALLILSGGLVTAGALLAGGLDAAIKTLIVVGLFFGLVFATSRALRRNRAD